MASSCRRHGWVEVTQHQPTLRDFRVEITKHQPISHNYRVEITKRQPVSHSYRVEITKHLPVFSALLIHSTLELALLILFTLRVVHSQSFLLFLKSLLNAQLMHMDGSFPLLHLWDANMQYCKNLGLLLILKPLLGISSNNSSAYRDFTITIALFLSLTIPNGRQLPHIVINPAKE